MAQGPESTWGWQPGLWRFQVTCMSPLCLWLTCFNSQPGRSSDHSSLHAPQQSPRYTNASAHTGCGERPQTAHTLCCCRPQNHKRHPRFSDLALLPWELPIHSEGGRKSQRCGPNQQHGRAQGISICRHRWGGWSPSASALLSRVTCAQGLP